MTVGIYKIQNNINTKVYIGCSTNIENRFIRHINNSKYNNKEYDYPLYQDFRKYGIDNFTFDIVHICEENELIEMEKYYIALYDSKNLGYNRNFGSRGAAQEFHHNTILTVEDIKNIRIRYSNIENCHDVYNDYKHIIGESGFKKIWNNITWKGIYQHVYTKDNLSKHLSMYSKGENNGRSKITEEDVINIRRAKSNGYKSKYVYSMYKDMISYKYFMNVWCGINWKGITI